MKLFASEAKKISDKAITPRRINVMKLIEGRALIGETNLSLHFTEKLSPDDLDFFSRLGYEIISIDYGAGYKDGNSEILGLSWSNPRDLNEQS